MLAAFDDDDDAEDEELEDEVASTAANHHKSTQGSGIIAPHAPHASAHDRGNRVDAEQESDCDIIIPRGKLAARLHGISTNTREKNPDGVAAVDNAYERIRHQLLGKASEADTERPEVAQEAFGKAHVMTSRLLQPRKKSRTIDSGGEQPLKNKYPRDEPSPSLVLSPKSPETAGKTVRHDSSPGPSITNDSQAEGVEGRTNEQNSSESELPRDPQANHRFLALVARKRQERQAKAADDKQRRADRGSTAKVQSKRQIQGRVATTSSSKNRMKMRLRRTEG